MDSADPITQTLGSNTAKSIHITNTFCELRTLSKTMFLDKTILCVLLWNTHKCVFIPQSLWFHNRTKPRHSFGFLNRQSWLFVQLILRVKWLQYTASAQYTAYKTYLPENQNRIIGMRLILSVMDRLQHHRGLTENGSDGWMRAL